MGVRPSASRSPRTVALLSAAGFAIVMGGAYAAFSAMKSTHRTTTTRPRLPIVAPNDRRDAINMAVASNPELQRALNRWNTVVHDPHSTVAQFAESYAETVQFHGSPGLATPGAIKTFFRMLFAGAGSLEMDWGQTTYREKNAELNEGVPAACINAPGATGKVLEVRAHGRETRNDRSAEIGCATLEGVYLFRLRRINNSLRICHETWSLREGICASCPTARACSGQR
jgi:hypothetical protein